MYTYIEMPAEPLAFLPGSAAEHNLPLARFLPPLPLGMVTGWLEKLLPARGWVIDPFGTAPQLPLEAARAGYRVLVATANPIQSFILETLASAPRLEDFQSALAVLAATRRGEERLERHLQTLYQTVCRSCGTLVTAQGYVWKRGEQTPQACLYHCSNCNSEGEFPLDTADLERLTLPGSDALHRSRALQRVANEEDEHYPAVEEALSAYLPRPLYALSTLINKQEGLSLPKEQRRLLHALLISACDAAGALWPWPGGRARPRQLSVPPQFREFNLWQALEEAVPVWTGEPGPLPLTHWPELPPESGGICLYPGRVKRLLPLPPEISPGAVITVLPRPNQAFWTLSALWAGWLWGREAALPLHPLLGRRRFDWSWHAAALHSPFSALGRALPPNIHFLGLLPELAPGFLAAVIGAAEAGGFHLEGLALRSDEEFAQILWKCAPAREKLPVSPNTENHLQSGFQASLTALNEPAPYLPVYASGLFELARQNGLPPLSEPFPTDLITRVQTAASRAFANRMNFRRFTTGSQEDERSLWWLTNPPQSAEPPLADRIEMEVVRYLQKNPACTLLELDSAVCQTLPGPLTPPADLVQAVLESYAAETPEQPGHWRLLPQEEATRRRADLEEARDALREIAGRIGFTAEGENPVIWRPAEFGPVYFFYLMASAVLGRHVLSEPTAPVRQCVLVFPGSRARLISFKLQRDPRMGEAIAGWRLLKLRQLRNLRETPLLTPAAWDQLLDEDPPYYDQAEQMRLL